MAEGEGGGSRSSSTPDWPTIQAFALAAEERGLDSLWLCDHFFRFPTEPAGGIHEAWTIVAALAASTSRVELGQLVVSTPFRNPALLAKMAATADAVSGGRLILGLGSGWADAESDAFGYPTDHRVGRFEEALQILVPLLGGETVTFAGRYHTVRDAVLRPPPDRRIPVLVAARRPQMVRLTARFADAWNTAWYGLPDDRLHAELGALHAALAAEGRAPSSIRRTVGMIVRDPDASGGGDAQSTGFAGSVDELAHAIDAYTALGIDDLIIGLEPRTERSLERLAKAISLRRLLEPRVARRKR
jgi:alkanesulfonate monooxygenase SsuD/methylene tetrahydromethanopterin reductase-like flavin-dependent oxidoreductase (luciferase family)